MHIPNSKYNKQLIKYTIKDDIYMNFLNNLNKNRLEEEKKCKPINLSYAYDELSIRTITNDNKLEFVDNSKNPCFYKIQHISELTNPMLYLSETKNFPPRWISPYKNINLPKYTYLKQWNSLYNCCPK